MSLRKGIFNIFDFDFNRLSLLEDPNKNVSYLRMIKPDIIWCVPSYLRLLAQEIRKMGDRDIRPQILICGGEMLDKHTRSFIEEVFKVKIFDEYGAVDVASRAVAWQCNLHNKYHQNIDGAYLEFIKEGEHVSPGEEGHIVATNLFRYAAPMIRYSIGDLGIPSEELCSCGMTFPLMESIQGRSDDCLIMPDGGIISPHTIMSILQNITGINRYQITQTYKTKIIAFIDILSHQQAQIIEKDIRLKFSRIFDKEVQLQLVFGPIPINKEKKYRAIKSNATI
jgi:phenylacetate-CoA ligase